MRQKHSQAIPWGEWIIQRSRFVGLTRQIDLAAAIGCTPNQLSRWAHMTNPPAMRKGFDAALATALKVDRQILFTGFRSVSPESAPIAHYEVADLLKRQVHAVVELLDADKLRELHQRGRELLKQEMATSAA